MTLFQRREEIFFVSSKNEKRNREIDLLKFAPLVEIVEMDAILWERH